MVISNLREEAVTTEQLAKAIDHTKLLYDNDANKEAEIKQLCEEAKENGFYAVCVRPDVVELAKHCLSGTDIKVATVIGFPAGKMELETEKQQPTVGGFTLEEKLSEVKQALLDNADELDLVMNVAQFKTDKQAVLNEIKAVVDASEGRPVKLIQETDLLGLDEVADATRLCDEAGCAMVKTSTGMLIGGVGAAREVVAKMLETIENSGSKMGVKASGGVRTQAYAKELLTMGISRIGTSSGAQILAGEKSENAY